MLINKPAHIRPIILQPAIEVCMTGIWSDSAPSNTLQHDNSTVTYIQV